MTPINNPHYHSSFLRPAGYTLQATSMNTSHSFDVLLAALQPERKPRAVKTVTLRRFSWQ